MRELILTPGVLDDIRSAFLWYEESRAGLGSKLEAAIDETLARIRSNPKCAPLVGPDGLRRIMLKRFPYHVYFKAQADAVRVIVFFHTSRNPHSLLNRLDH